VKSMYLDFISDQTRYLQKYIWKIKVLLKIKIFMWFLHGKVILTKYNFWLRGIGRIAKLVVPLTRTSPFNTYSFIDHLPRSFGDSLYEFSLSLANATNLFKNWLANIP
jgi:hypothetical protein